MTRTFSKFAFGLIAVAASVAVFGHGNDASARGKEGFTQDIEVKTPMHGYSGHAGYYYCDYQRLPKRQCTYSGGQEKCRIVGWTMREMCQ